MIKASCLGDGWCYDDFSARITIGRKDEGKGSEQGSVEKFRRIATGSKNYKDKEKRHRERAPRGRAWSNCRASGHVLTEENAERDLERPHEIRRLERQADDQDKEILRLEQEVDDQDDEIHLDTLDFLKV